MSTLEKIINILDPQAGEVRESVLQERPENDGPMSLREASMLNEFPVLLRDGIRSIAFDRYMQTPTTYQLWCAVERSDKQSEDWVEENMLGEFPVVHEGTAYPEVKLDLDRTVNIRNYKWGETIGVTEEMIRFNKTLLLKQFAAKMGRQAANTREQAAISIINTAGNYNRTTADNDVGNNTGATVFSADGLNTAMTTLRTMKDRKSGAYLGVEPDTLIVTPRLEVAAKQLLLSPAVQIPGDGVTTAKIYGTGTANPFRGWVKQIIVSPRFGSSYQWCLMESKQAVVMQVVDDLQILQETPGLGSEAYFKYDVLRYRARDWFGVGMLNDRYAYYSSSSSAPAVA